MLPLPPVSPITNILSYRGTFVTTDELKLIHYWLKTIVYVREYSLCYGFEL